VQDTNHSSFDYTRWARPVTAIYWLVLFVTTHWPRLDVQVNGTSAGEINLDKPIHAVAFGLLAWLFWMCKPLGREAKRSANWLLVFAIVSGYAYVDEITQIFFERTFAPADLLSNLVGIVLVMAAVASRSHASHAAMHWARITLLVLIPVGLITTLTPGGTIDWSWWLPMGPNKADRFELRADYVQHLIVALIVTLLLTAARPLGRDRPGRGLLLAVLAMVLGGAGLELVQHQVGRGAEWLDLLSHLIGVLMAVAIAFGVRVASSREMPAPQPTVADEPEPTKDEPSSTSFVRHAKTVSGLTLVSRFTGLLRDAVLASVLGLTGVADAFFMGFLLPNLFRRLFGEGALSAAFIPAYTDLLAKDKQLARRLASACIGLLAILLGVIVVIGEGILYQVQFVRDWTPTTLLAIKLMMVMLPYMPLVCLVALIGGMLHVHHRFGSTAAVPILLNLSMIVAAFVAGRMFDPQRAVMYVGTAVVVAGALQLAWQILAILPHEKFTAQWPGVSGPMKEMFKVMLPMLIGLAVFQLNAAMDSLIAFGLSSKEAGDDFFMLLGYKVAYPIETGAVAALNWAQRLYQFPLGVFGIAVATAIFPALSRAAVRRQQDNASNFGDILRNGLRLTVFIGLPASFGLILVRVPLCRLIYQYGKFDVADAQRVAVILIGYASVIWAYSMMHVLTRAFYAVKDAKTPLRISLTTVLLNALLNCVLIWFLGAAGLAWSTAICAAWQVCLLARAAKRYVERPIDGDVWRAWGRCALLSVLMAAPLAVVVWLVPFAELSRGVSAGVLAGMVAGGVLVYAGGAWLMNVAELRWLLQRRAA